MADYHFVYKDLEGTSTEWDDIQRRLGNLPPKPPVQKPEPWAPSDDRSAKDQEWIDTKSVEELEELGDDLELDDDRFLQEYRKKRLAELQDISKKARYGSVLHISGSDFVKEVSQAPPDVWVVVHLYKDGVSDCGILGRCFDELAVKYPATKFVKIVSTDCIPKYPDFNLPTVLIYNNTNVKATLVGLHHFGGNRCTPEDVAFTLCQVGPVLADSEHDGASKSMTEKVREDFLKQILTKHEQDESDLSGDDD